MQDFEKIGAFYLGRVHDPARQVPSGESLLYDARDLTTHAVCVGMTGSGKTGLCIALLEEAAIDGIPALVIDPKGDLADLMLTFPDLAPEDFAPWVDPEAARRRGIPVEALAREQAERWKRGLEDWGQDGSRIRRLRDAAQFTLYTPGSTAGRPVSILSSFAAPPPAVRGDRDLLGERAASTVTSLLGLLAIDADPLRSREHILLTTILVTVWQRGEDVDLATLIQAIQSPPVARIGVVELETFFPAKERFQLAMALNNVLASPTFQNWLAGEPLDVGRLLFDGAGKPRVAIFSIAHLGDAERMFFVSLLLEQTIAWMRGQPGTTSLRAVLYMDEIFGYFPPTANPPSKRPLLVLMKQARAFGLGVVLATQNPVDLDYKGLANAGTWFIGKLQTERDRARLLDGLQAAGGNLDRAAIEKLLDALDKRIFLLHDVHAAAPLLFETRWTLSYLRGPLTRDEIKRLGQGPAAAESSPVAPAPESAAAAVGAPRAVPAPAGATTPPAPVALGAPPLAAESAPVLPPDVPQAFLPVRGRPPAGGGVVYVPMLLGQAALRFAATSSKVEAQKQIAILATLPATSGAVAWADGRELQPGVEPAGAPGGAVRFAALAAEASQAQSYARWRRELADWLCRNQALELWRCAAPRAASKPGEPEREFRIRLRDLVRERVDALKDALRVKYAPRLQRLQDQVRRAEQARAREAEQAKAQKVQTAVSLGATLLGAFLGGGRRSTVGRAATTARGLGRAQKESQDVARADETLEVLQQRLADLDAEFQSELSALETGADAQKVPIERVEVRPKKADVVVQSVRLAWAPHWQQPDGSVVAAWE